MQKFRTTNGAITNRLQLALYRCAEDARAIDTRAYEIELHERIDELLVPALDDIAERAVEALGEILGVYELPEGTDTPPGGGPAPENSGVFNSVFEFMVEERSGPAAKYRRIVDVSFVARWELERKRAALAAMAKRKTGWSLLSECCSTRRRVVKATSGVERVLSDAEGQPSTFGDLYQTERQIAVDARSAYYSFVSELRKAEQQHGRADIERFIRLGGTGLARLFGRQSYQDFRIEDRMEMRRLQERVFDWLRGDQDQRAGERLMSDVSSFASLIMQINRRPALIEHDREVLRKLERALGVASANKRAFYQLLKTIRGRDPHLDELIDANVDLQPRWWQEHVTRVLETLSEPES